MSEKMSSTGRRKHFIWLYFEEVKHDNRKGSRAKCKKCNIEIEGQVARMKKHLEKCADNQVHHSEDSADSASLPGTSSSLCSIRTESTDAEEKLNQQKKKLTNNLDSFLSKTTASQKIIFDEQVARFVYATNTSFKSVEHPEFIKMIKNLRPEYTPPSRKQIAGDLLERVYLEEREKCSKTLKNEVVTLGLDRWSNVHNEPIICATLTTKDSNTFLIDTIDTSGTAHTAENLYSMCIEIIKNCEYDVKCFIGSLVTDNTGNGRKTREMLDENKEFDIITYGCAAHILNLLANDIDYPNIREQILKIIKYFRNNHYANACYRSNTSLPKLTMPCEVRWNSFTDALETYLKSWPALLNICEDHKDKIDKNIQSLISNIALKRNAENYFQQLKPIAVALDKIQRNDCTIGEVVFIFKNLKKKMEEMALNKDTLKKFDARYKMAVTPVHLLSYLLDPKPKTDSFELSSNEKQEALEYAKNKFPNNSLLPLIMKFHAKSFPFQKYLFEEDFMRDITPLEWWQSQEADIKKFNTNVFKEIELILTAKATTASVERMFSSFGLVQSKLHNRLGIEKAAKLVFLFKMFNPHSVEKMFT